MNHDVCSKSIQYHTADFVITYKVTSRSKSVQVRITLLILSWMEDNKAGFANGLYCTHGINHTGKNHKVSSEYLFNGVSTTLE